MRLRPRILAVAAAVFAIAGALLVPSMAAADVQPSQVPAGLNTAIRDAVEGRGHQYAGLCREIEQSQHIGQWCAFVQELDEYDAAVTFGPVLSDQIESANFDNRNQNRVWVESTSQAPGEDVPESLRSAIEKAVEARGETYAGLCKEIVDQSQHIGEWCGFVEAIRANDADVAFGPVLSDELYAARFVRSGDSWMLATGGGSGVPLPPATGSGTVDDGSGTSWLVIVVAGAVLVAGSLGLAATARRR